MIDLDHFKAINDSLGHREGDKVLRLFGHTLAATVRAADQVGRYGGEEFVVILPENGAERFLARLRIEWMRARPYPVTFSAGLACRRPRAEEGPARGRLRPVPGEAVGAQPLEAGNRGGLPVIGPSSGPARPPDARDPGRDAVERYLEQAVNGDGRAERRLASKIDNGVKDGEVIVDLRETAQREVGERWLANRWNVAEEHLVSGVTQKALDAIARDRAARRRLGGSR